MKNNQTGNLSSCGANYQHSGLENLRANETDEHAPIISGTGPATDRIAAKYQTDGLTNMRADEKDVHAGIIGVSQGKGTPYKPGPVDSFNGAAVR